MRNVCSSHERRRDARTNHGPAVRHTHRCDRLGSLPSVSHRHIAFRHGMGMCAGAYVFGESGSNSCPAGSVAISTAAACRAAASATALSYISASSEDSYPAGCYRWTQDGDVYFNTHITGGSDSNSQPLCSPGGSAGISLGLVVALQFCGLASGLHRRLLLQRPPTSATHARPPVSRQPGLLSRLLSPERALRPTSVTLRPFGLPH
jgi:hypothetical protein